jgi:hypothetical protein
MSDVREGLRPALRRLRTWRITDRAAADWEPCAAAARSTLRIKASPTPSLIARAHDLATLSTERGSAHRVSDHPVNGASMATSLVEESARYLYGLHQVAGSDGRS